MLSANPFSSRFITAALLAAMVAAFGLTVRAQDGQGKQQTPYLDDWTHHHLVFSDPGTREDAVRNGRLDRWQKITSDQRYLIQQGKRTHSARPVMDDDDRQIDRDHDKWGDRRGGRGHRTGPSPFVNTIEKDWAQPLGGITSTLVSSIPAALSATYVSGSSAITVDGQTFTASAPTQGTQTGTFSALPSSITTSPGSITIVNGANTLTATTAATQASYIGTFSATPSSTTTISVTVGANTLLLSNSATFASFPLTFGGDAGSGTIVIAYSASGTTNTLTMSPNPTTNGCTSATTGTFVDASSKPTETANFTTAITNCHTTYPQIGVTASTAGFISTLKADLPGNFLTVTNTLANTSGAIVAGTNGTNACGSSTTGTFATSNSTTTLAGNLNTALGLCPAGAGLYSTTGTNTVTVYDRTFGYQATTFTVTDAGPAGIFAWGAITNGTNGANSCASSTSLGFQLNAANTTPTTTTAATNLAAEIAACNTSFPAIGVTATGGATVAAKADSPGSTPGITLGSTFNNFSWTAATFTNGTNGANSSTAFKYWNTAGTGYDTGTQLATDLAAALAANATVNAAVSTVVGTDQITFGLQAGHTGPYEISTSQFGAISPAGTIGTATAATVQPNALPAKYGASLTTASCADFVVYPTGQVGSASAATILAYTNLYSSCTGTVPSVAWAYNTGSGYAVTTSPTLSKDGTEVIFVQSNGSTAQLVVLKVSVGGGTLTAPSTPTTVSNITAACANACYTVTSLPSNDTLSSPYYAYTNTVGLPADTLYVGTDVGTLLSISPVLTGTIPTTFNSVTLTGAGMVASPVYDQTSGCVFVGDTNGFLYSVDSGQNSGSLCNSGTFQSYGRSEQLGVTGAGIFDAPIIDATQGTVYVFVGEAASGGCIPNANCVAEFADTTITSGSTTAAPANTASLGSANTAPNPIYAGSFDNIYFTSATGVGNLYVVGGTGLTSAATLWRVPISTGGVISATVGAATVTSGAAYPWPSPVTEFLNGSTDYAFFSVNQGAALLGCTAAAGNGCILSFDISTGTTATQSGSGQNYTTPGTNGCWATTGMIIDNSDTTTGGASQIYFINLNGIDAGGAGGATATSTNCTTGTTTTIQGVQASQNNP